MFRKTFKLEKPSNESMFYVEPPVVDPFVRSQNVVKIDNFNLENFLHDKDVAIVMFYDPADKECNLSRKEFKEASLKTKRYKHGYAAIDCTKYRDVCCEQGVTKFPFYKIYTRGKYVGFNSGDSSFTSKDIRNLIETVPVVEGGQKMYNP